MNDATPANPNPHGKPIALPMVLIIVGSMVLAMLIVSAVIRWMPTPASTFAGEVDFLYYFIYWVSVFFTLLIAGLLVFFLLYYRQTDKARLGPGKVTHSTVLELTWTIIPVFIVLAIFAVGFKGYMNMAVAPTGSYEILVTANQWGWAFQYPNGYTDNNLHIPADRDVKLTLQSKDVIHSLYIPQFRAKKDVVPGRYNSMWFHSKWEDRFLKDHEATLEYGDGTTEQVLAFDLYCTEYCGQSHSQMNRKVYLHKTQTDFDAWMKDAAFIPGRFAEPRAWGEVVWKNQCSSCHSIDGSSGTGPTWKDLFGSQRELTDGSTVTADEAYIMESIYDPQAKIRKGYESQNMASFQGQLKDLDVFAVTQFIKSVSKDQQADDQWGKYSQREGEADTAAGDQPEQTPAE